MLWSRTFRSICIWLLAVSMLSACGFHLQGYEELPPQMETVYLDTSNRYTEFYQSLVAELKAREVRVVESSSEAETSIRILLDFTDQRVISVSSRNVPTEFEVFYTISFDVQESGVQLLAPQRLTLTRDYTYDETLVLGKAAEEEFLRQDLARALARQVMRQLSKLG